MADKCIWELKGITYKWFNMNCSTTCKKVIPYQTVVDLTMVGNLKYCFCCGKEIANIDDRIKEITDGQTA